MTAVDRAIVAEGKRQAAAELRAAAKDHCTSCALGWPLTQNRFGRWVHPEPPPAYPIAFEGDGPPLEWYCDAPALHTRAQELDA